MSESIDLKQNFDISDFLGQLSKAEEQVSSLKAELEETPGTPKALSAGLDRTLHTIDLLEKKAQTVTRLSDGKKDIVLDDLISGMAEVNAAAKLFSGDGKFSASLAKQMFHGFPEAIRKELANNTREIEKLIRSSQGSIKSFGASNMARDILMTNKAQELFGKRFRHTSGDQFAKYIEMLLPHVLPSYTMEEFSRSNKGRITKVYANLHPYEMIPRTFQNSFKNKAYMSAGSSTSMYMQEEYQKMLRNIVSESDAAMRAAEKVPGMIRRSTSGRAQISRNISQAQYDQFKANMWHDWVLRTSGTHSNKIDIFADNLSEADERKLLSRMSSSSAGRVLSAMGALDPFEESRVWTSSSRAKGFETLKEEARRELEQYEISRFKFSDIFNGKYQPRPVMLSESQNTRLLGLSGSHNQFTDKIAVIDLSGYDKENSEHRKLLEQLSSGQAISLPGVDKKYVAQNLHGTGRNTTFRLVEAEAYKKVRDAEKTWLEKQGFSFSGNNYWNNFVSDDFVFDTEEALRKHYDATGKGWTPGYAVKSNLQNKTFGIVDQSKLNDAGRKTKQADGLAWVTNGILSEGSIQARAGVSGKGVINEIPFNTMGEWAINAGLIKPGERFILPGPRGNVDATDLNGISDVSQVKNIAAYNSFTNSEDMNRAFTALMQRYGISTVTSFNNAESKVNSLGHQAMMFMKLSPEIAMKQISAADRRLKMLDTEAGIKEFIFSDPNDYLAKMLREDRILPTDKMIQNRVQKEKDSIVSRLAGGEWLDFDGSVSGYNQKVNKSLITSIAELQNNTREEKIRHLRALMKQKGLTKDYSDDEIAGIWGLGGVNGGAVVDFLRPEEDFVAVNRAPNGIAQFVSGRNYAKLARDVYSRFGVSANGIFLSEEDMQTLSDADFDGDGVKVMYGDTAREMAKASDLYRNIIDKLIITSSPQHIPDSNVSLNHITDSPEQRRRAAEDSLAAVLAMGLTSSAGEKATMFDLTDPQNRDMLIAAVQSNPAYSYATVLGKKGGKVELTREMWAASGQGKIWQKLPSKYSNLFNITGQDDLDIPDDKDIYTAHNGVKINLAQLREMDIDRINMPSANQDSVQVGLRIASQFGSSPEGIARSQAVLEALDQVIGYGNANEKTKTLMQNMRYLKLGMATGERGIANEEEYRVLSMQFSEAEKETADLAKSKMTGGGKVHLDDGTETTYAAYLAELQKQAGLDVVKAYLYTYGATVDRIKSVYGEDEGSKIAADLVSNEGINLPNEVVSSVEDLLRKTEPDAIVAKTTASGIGKAERKARTIEKQNEETVRHNEDHIADNTKSQENVSIFDQWQNIKTFEGSLQAEKELSEYIRQVSGKWYRTYAEDGNNPEQSFYSLALYQLKKAQNDYDVASIHGDPSVFGSGTATGETLFEALQNMEVNYFNATRAHLSQSGESVLDALRNSVQGVGDEFDKQLKKLEKWKSEVTALKNQLDAFKESRDRYSSTATTDLEADAQEIKKQESRIAEAEELEKEGRANLLKENKLRFTEYVDDFMYQLTGKLADPRSRIDREVASKRTQLNDKRLSLEIAHQKQLISDNDYDGLIPLFDNAIRYVDNEYKTELEKRYEETLHKDVSSFVRHADRFDIAHRRRMINNTAFGRNLGQIESELEQRRHFDEIGTSKLKEMQNIGAPQTEIDNLTVSLEKNRIAMENLEGARGKLAAGMQTLGNVASRVATRFGHQLMNKAVNELKRFTLEFSNDMATIQATTLKTDEEMADVRRETLADAIAYRTSVSNVSAVRNELYRQGLSDEEVSQRSGDILKFAKVTGMKVNDATKIITTALENNLVDSAQKAMDALVALGDSSATSADQIGAAMQKCAASAKVAGVSYSELTAMLTVMTSTTQLSGKQVGSAMNTILTRMQKVTKTGYTKSLNGEVTTYNDVQNALNTIGVSLMDENEQWRNPTDVLLDIAKQWGSMNDVQRSLVTSSIAGTERANMFQTLMEGIAEDGGKQFEEYLGLAEDSDGITSTKYEVSVRSLSAAIDTLVASYDRLVAGVESSQIGQVVLDFISGILEGFGNLIDYAPDAASGLVSLIAPLSIIVGLLTAAKGGTILGTIAGLAVAGAGLWIGSNMGHEAASDDPKKRSRAIAEGWQNSQNNYSASASERKETEDLIKETKKLGAEYEKLGSSMDDAASKNLEDNLRQLTTLFPDINESLKEGNDQLSNWATITDQAAQSTEELTKAEMEQSRVRARMAAAENFDDSMQEEIDEIVKSYKFVSQEELSALRHSEPLTFDIIDLGIGHEFAEEQAAEFKKNMLRTFDPESNNLSDFIYNPLASDEQREEFDQRFANKWKELSRNNDRYFFTDKAWNMSVEDGSSSDTSYYSLNTLRTLPTINDLNRKTIEDYIIRGTTGNGLSYGEAANFAAFANELDGNWHGWENFGDMFIHKQISMPVSSEASELEQIIDSYADINEYEFTGLHSAEDVVRLLNLADGYKSQIGNENEFFDTAKLDQLLYVQYEQAKLDNYSSWGYANATEFVEDIGNGFVLANNRGTDVDSIKAEIAEKVFQSISDNSFLQGYFDSVNQQIVTAYENGVITYLDTYVPEVFLNPQADAAYKDAVFNVLKARAPKIEGTDAIDYQTFVSDKWLAENVDEAIATVEQEGKETYADPRTFNVVYVNPDGSDVAQGFDTYEAAVSFLEGVSTRLDKTEEERNKWLTTQKQHLFAGGQDGVTGTRLYYTQGEYGEQAYSNWQLKNPNYRDDMLRVLGLVRRPDVTSIEGLESVMPDDIEWSSALNQNPMLNLARQFAFSRKDATSFALFAKVLQGTYSGQDTLGHDDYMSILSYGFGSDFQSQLAAGTFDTSQQENQDLFNTAMQDEAFVQWLNVIKDKYSGLDEVINALTGNQELSAEAQKELAHVMEAEGIRSAEKYNKNLEQIIDTYSALSKGGKSAEDAVQDLNRQMKSRDYAQYSLNALKTGKANDQDFSVLSSFFGIDEEELRRLSEEEGSESLKWMIASMEAELGSYDDDLKDLFKRTILAPINNNWDAIAAKGIELGNPIIVDGQVNISNLLAAIDAAGIQMSDTMKKYIASLSLESDGQSLSIVFNEEGTIKTNRGGGRSKTAAEKLLDSQRHDQTIRDHIIKMIQYEESMYQNAGQLTNYGIMIQHEIDEEKRQAVAKKEQIAALEEQISKTKQYSDDWYTLRDAIMNAEEEYEQLTNAIEENNKKLEENQQAILKLHTELEQTVKQEIETRIKEERDMLSGTVSMQSIIVEAIRERYREEWELMQKDIEKKRNALEEEKALIDERLNRRKEAEDEAKKHEELAEYQKQLALISMDPTRTSDVATLREKIQTLEEELAWDLAEDEAKMQQDALQDQIDAYDQYEQEYQEWLDKYLEDANNFTDEVTHVMGLGHDELMQWLKDNVTEFGNSLEAAQEQMIQGWGDTFKQMKGIVDTYWDEINKVLSSKENFIAYMQESSSYKNASEDEKKQMLYNWGKAYDDYIAASVVSDEAVNYEHSDEFKGSSSKESNTKQDKAPVATPESRYELLSLEEEIKQSLAKKTFAPVAKFAEGGLVDYTGPAWVDGTKAKPESFLDAEDTSLLRAMLDGWKHVRNLPFMSNVSGVAEHGDGMSIGEVNVTLNEAQFNTDDDYEVIAQKVGAAFTKELSKQGFITASYAF